MPVRRLDWGIEPGALLPQMAGTAGQLIVVSAMVPQGTTFTLIRVCQRSGAMAICALRCRQRDGCKPGARPPRAPATTQLLSQLTPPTLRTSRTALRQTAPAPNPPGLPPHGHRGFAGLLSVASNRQTFGAGLGSPSHAPGLGRKPWQIRQAGLAGACTGQRQTHASTGLQGSLAAPPGSASRRSCAHSSVVPALA
jgi:hypothetical protein